MNITQLAAIAIMSAICMTSIQGKEYVFAAYTFINNTNQDIDAEIVAKKGFKVLPSLAWTCKDHSLTIPAGQTKTWKRTYSSMWSILLSGLINTLRGWCPVDYITFTTADKKLTTQVYTKSIFNESGTININADTITLTVTPDRLHAQGSKLSTADHQA
jgi:hypothetical protein